MNRQGPLILLLLVAYIFLPPLLRWVTDASSGWYKPFIVWMAVILGAYLMQRRSAKNDP
jgi:Kef-type K+ transport system membrane component KefB